MTLWEEQFKPEHDLESTVGVTTRYAICSTERSGSHYLGRLLKATGECGDPLEYFNPQNLAEWIKRSRGPSSTEVLPYLESIRSTPNGCFGMKIHFAQLPSMEEHLDLSNFLSDFKMIWIRRRDLLRQGVSYAKASQTGSFISDVEERREARYDPVLILECMAAIAAQNASWELLFSSTGVDVFNVFYEELRTDEARHVSIIGDYLGVNLAAESEAARVTIAKQSDDRNEEWVQRFRRDFQDLSIDSARFNILRAARRTLPKRILRRVKRTFFAS